MAVAPPPNFDYLYESILLIIFAFIEYRFKLTSHLEGKFLYFILSYFSIIGIIIGTVLFINWDENILLIRTVGIGNSGHILSWFAVISVCAYFGYKNIIKGVVYAGAVSATHEIISVGFTFITGITGVSVIQGLDYYSTYFVLIGALLICFFAMNGIKDIKALLVSNGALLIYSTIIFVTVGGLGTTNLTGPTNQYYNLWYNALEEISWILPAAVFILVSYMKKQSVYIWE